MYAQREEVAEHVRGWRVIDVLIWLRRYGIVEEVPRSEDGSLYRFVSNYT